MATNSVIISLANSSKSTTTTYSRAHFTAIVASIPVALVGRRLIYERERANPDSELSTASKVGIVAASMPLSLLWSGAAPVIMGVTFVTQFDRQTSNVGDLTPVPEDEDM